MGDENPIHTLGDYSKPIHEGYRNTIELPVGNNMVPLRSDTIRLVQNDLLQKVPHNGIDRWLHTQIFYDHVSFHLKFEIDRTAGGKLRDKNANESWEIIDNLSLYDHEGWNDIKEFVKPVKAVSLPQSTSKTPDRRLLELKDLISFLLKGSQRHPDQAQYTPLKLMPKPSTQTLIHKTKINHQSRTPLLFVNDIRGNFEILCNIGGLKHMNALVDQGSDVNVMPLSTYMKLTDKRPIDIDIRLSLASHSYIYPLGIGEDVLVEVAEHVYLVDFVYLDIKEDEKMPFTLGTSFLTMAKVVIKFDKSTITLRSGKSKISFHIIPESFCKDEKGIKNDIEPIAPTVIVNKLVLEWEEKIKLYHQKEMEFDRWRNKNFKNKRPAPIKIKYGMDDKGEVT
nr:hypothetical protein [Tanacetum cinerariifolium]